jgi:hypothetical protein
LRERLGAIHTILGGITSVFQMIQSILFFFFLLGSLDGAEPYTSGWHNLPGVEISAEDFLSLHPEVDLIFSYSQANWTVKDRLDRPRQDDFQDLDFLDPDRAYWIHSNPIYSLQISGNGGDIAISFTASSESTTTLQFFYSSDNGTSWSSSSNVTGTLQIESQSKGYNILWHSDQDLAGTSQDVRIRLEFGTGDSKSSGVSKKFEVNQSQNGDSSPAPTLLNYIPAADDTAVPANLGRVDLRFSRSLLPASIASQSLQLRIGNETIPGTISHAGEVLSFFFSQKLEYDSLYTVVLQQSIQSLRGIPLEQELSFNFRTVKAPRLDLFEAVSEENWTDTAVRKVLHIFAFGGLTSDSQVAAWAAMTPQEAIEEMLTLYPANYRLSPPQADQLHTRYSTLRSLANHWASTNSEIELDLRHEYDLETEENVPVCTWITAATKRGLNPFFKKIGLFETNYHLAVNQDKDLSAKELIGYYDRVMTEHVSRSPYQRVMGAAAISPAVARQYKHDDNRYEDGNFFGNEDFAREIHQLFFGILGNSSISDPAFSTYPSTLTTFNSYADYHEFISIRHTARALTDMSTHGEEDEIAYGTSKHHQAPLEILGGNISGNTAREKIESLIDLDIQHPESLRNLPLIIIQTLADDTMDEDTRLKVQQAWASMGDKDFLNFIRSYAISTSFHRPARVKFLTSFDRILIYHNLTHTSNLVSYHDTSLLAKLLTLEDAEFFRPIHNVFGGQTGLEASSSSKVLKEAFNTSATRHGETLDAHGTYAGQAWERDWGALVPTTDSGKYEVAKVGEWLWQRLIADGLKNFQTLERAQVYALLAQGKDFSGIADPSDTGRVYTSSEIEEDTDLQSTFLELAASELEYLSDYRDNRNQKRWDDNSRIGLALSFIAATPFMFAQEGQ